MTYSTMLYSMAAILKMAATAHIGTFTVCGFHIRNVLYWQDNPSAKRHRFTTICTNYPHCFVYYDKTWMKTVLTCFTTMIAEQPSLTQYERPMYHNESKTNMLSSTDNNFNMIYLLDFERFSKQIITEKSGDGTNYQFRDDWM